MAKELEIPTPGQRFVQKKPGILGMTQEWIVMKIMPAITRTGPIHIVELHSRPSKFVVYYDIETFHKIFQERT